MTNQKQQLSSSSVLVVDDEPTALDMMRLALRGMGITDILLESDALNVSHRMKENDVSLVLLDLVMPQKGGETILQELTENYPEVPVIIITGLNDVETAMRCVRSGAFDYIVKPVEEDRLELCINRAMEMQNLRKLTRRFSEEWMDEDIEKMPEALRPVIGNSPSMDKVLRYCQAVATSSEPVLITGETGTGKELISRALHELSGRGGEFVAVNIAGVSDSLLEDMLFGHTRGAFTGAVDRRPGLIEQAAGGTLFLDEIGDMGTGAQVKLLRLLQEREYIPVGSDKGKKSDVRILLATHHKLEQKVAEGSFRKDLYYRIKIHRVALPALRNRLEDLPLLLRHFLQEASREKGISVPTVPAELIDLLESYSFPGNVRELRSMVCEAVQTHGGKTMSMQVFRQFIAEGRKDSVEEPEITPAGRTSWASMLREIPTLKEADRVLIKEALRRSKGRQSIAAGMLGITPSALNMRLKKLRREEDEGWTLYK